MFTELRAFLDKINNGPDLDLTNSPYLSWNGAGTLANKFYTMYMLGPTLSKSFSIPEDTL